MGNQEKLLAFVCGIGAIAAFIGMNYHVFAMSGFFGETVMQNSHMKDEFLHTALGIDVSSGVLKYVILGMLGGSLTLAAAHQSRQA